MGQETNIDVCPKMLTFLVWVWLHLKDPYTQDNAVWDLKLCLIVVRDHATFLTFLSLYFISAKI